MRKIIITLALLFGLNLSAQEKKAYEIENGVIKIETFYQNGELDQVSYYLNNKAVRVWEKYNEKGILTMKVKMKNGRPAKITHFREGKTITIDRDFN